MAHVLKPKAGQSHIPIERALALLNAEFDDVDVSFDEGNEHVSKMAAKWIQLKAPQQMIDDALLGLDQSCRVVISEGTDEDSYIMFTLQPNENPFIGYHSARHERSALPVLTRCANALDYDVVLV